MDIYVNEAHFIRHSTDKSDSVWFINDKMILRLITVKMISPIMLWPFVQYYIDAM